MAITRLSDLITVFESKWTYGDVKFGYESDVNEDHDTKYPLMLIQPPASIIPEIYDGREEYEFEINFYNLYPQAAQSVVTLQKRWDNLQDLAMEWFDMVLKFYQDVTVEAYLNDESLEIERVKEVANDRLVQIKFVFTMSAFTKCFRPVSAYPSDFSDLALWYKADSGVDYDIPTKKVSSWTDQSSNSIILTQNSESKKPLRYGYDGANDKEYLHFDGVDDEFRSTDHLPISSTEFTAFIVAKQHTAQEGSGRVFNYTETGVVQVTFGFLDDKHYVAVGDLQGNIVFNAIGVASNYAIIRMEFRNTGRLNVGINGSTGSASTLAGWSPHAFNENTFDICRHAKANLAELIMYNRVLFDSEWPQINDYLNTKYKIY